MKSREAIEKEIVPLLSFIEKPGEINFDDELLAIFNSLISNTGYVSPVQWLIAKTFPSIYEKDNHTLSNLFQSLNLLIVYGKEEIKKDPSFIDLVNLPVLLVN